MRGDVANIDLPFTRHDKDARGNVRWYYVREGRKKVRLNPKGVEVGSSEFFARYNQANDAFLAGAAEASQRAHRTPGTLAHLIDQYLSSPQFNQLAERTQRSRSLVLKDLMKEHGPKSAAMPASAIRAGRDARAATPAAANNRVKVISALYQWAIEAGLAQSNPARGIKKLREGVGHHTWTRDQVEQYRSHWPIGTRQRLALEFAYELAQRRGDVARFGPQHIAGSRIKFEQEKTGKRMSLAITQRLAEAIRGTHAQASDSFLGLTSESLGNVFREWREEAGLPSECTLHGLRKARLTHLAEDGATAHQLRAVGGHESLKEVETYTENAEQERLADSAFGKQTVPSFRPGTIKNRPSFDKRKKKQ